MTARERAEARFWSKVDMSGDCWLWTAAVQRNGYGLFWFNGRLEKAHRWAYMTMVGAIPAATPFLDHLCRNPSCVRTAHLEPVTNRENVMRGLTPNRSGCRKREQRECVHGHPFDEENTRHYAGRRHCKECRRIQQRTKYALDKAARLALPPEDVKP